MPRSLLKLQNKIWQSNSRPFNEKKRSVNKKIHERSQTWKRCAEIYES